MSGQHEERFLSFLIPTAFEDATSWNSGPVRRLSYFFPSSYSSIKVGIFYSLVSVWWLSAAGSIIGVGGYMTMDFFCFHVFEKM